MVMSLIDVFQGALLETLSEAIVLFVGDVVVRLVEQFGGAAETAAPLEVSVDRRVIVQILAVFDGGLLNLGDGVIDFVDGFLFLFTQFPAVGALQVGSGGTQIRQGMQISRVIAAGFWSRRNISGHEKQCGQHDKCQFREHFHRL